MMDMLRLLAANLTVPNEQVGIPQVAANDDTIGIIARAVFIVLGGVATLFLVIGGFRYIISNGDQAKIKKAKDTILYAVVGIVISLVAFAIVQFVLGVIVR